MPNAHRPLNVALACQGGGAHAAFSAGVLQYLLTCPHYAQSFTIAALSGTSGGALCAALAWSRLLRPRKSPPANSPATRAAALDAERSRARAAADALHDYWEDLACDDELSPFGLFDSAANAVGVALTRSLPGFEHNCKAISALTRDRMLELLRRHLPLNSLRGLDLLNPALRIGATDIALGATDVLNAEDFAPDELHTLLLASAAIPPLFQPVKLRGHYYWDGLYSHNPPVDCFTNLHHDHEPTPIDEIWIIQINPDSSHKLPVTMADIVDRRNELQGNLTLSAEMYHIDRINRLLHNRRLSSTVRRQLQALYKPITLRRVCLHQKLDYASKLDRSRARLHQLISLGHRAAPALLNKSNTWTCPESGVHRAPLANSPRPSTSTNIPPSLVFCTELCPAAPLCNSMPFLPSLGQRSYDLLQKTMDYSV